MLCRAVGQLDQDDPDIPGHGQEHLAEILRLRLGTRTEIQVGQLGDAVHELGDLFVELLGEPLLGDARILDDIVQQGRHQAFVVHVQAPEDTRHGDRMIDIGLAREALLPFVRLGAEQVGAIDLAHLLRAQVILQLSAKITDEKTLLGGNRSGDLARGLLNGGISSVA